MYFSSSNNQTTYAAAGASGGLTFAAMTWAHYTLLIFALAFAAFVVYRIVMRVGVVSRRRLLHLPHGTQDVAMLTSGAVREPQKTP